MINMKSEEVGLKGSLDQLDSWKRRLGNGSETFEEKPEDFSEKSREIFFDFDLVLVFGFGFFFYFPVGCPFGRRKN